jgi:HAD superfamily hydrolase (TIGR01484 family)
MRFEGLATDYDGTIAWHGEVMAETEAALQRLKEFGRKVILVTGREMHELKLVCPCLPLFDLIVAENGGLLHWPESGRERLLTREPPEELVDCLRRRGVTPLTVGRSIIATQEIYSGVIQEVLDELECRYHAIPNKGALMILPSDVDKRSGLLAALEELNLQPDRIAGVGDAENDWAFLEICGCSAAVANALPSLKKLVRILLRDGHGSGVEELIERMISNDLNDLPPKMSQAEIFSTEAMAGKGG